MIEEKIQGKVFASEPLNGRAQGHTISEYQKGVDVWTIDETSKDAWLANGHNDTIPYLHRLIYQRSGIHKSAVDIKSKLIAGGGLEFEPLESYYRKNEDGYFELVEESLSDSAKAQLVKQAQLFDKNTNLSKYTVKGSSQLSLYGGYYGFRTYMKDRNAKTMLRRLYIEPYINMRLGAKRRFIDNEFKSEYHYISDDWTSASPYQVMSYDDLRNGVKRRHSGNIYRIPVDTGMIYQDNEMGIFSKMIGNVTDYRNFYPTPDYESVDALCYMDIDYMLSQRDFKDLDTGFSLDYVVVRYRAKRASETDEKAQRKKDVDFFKKKFSGFDGDNTLMMWAEPAQDEQGKVQTPKLIDIIPVPNNNTAERYNVLREERLLKILNAHCIVTGEIIGLPRLSTTGFSSQAEFLITAQEHLYWSVIKPMQQILLDDIQEILINAGIPVKPAIKKNTANYRQLTKELLQWAWGKDEIREMHGWAKMSEDVAEEVMRITTVKEQA